MRHRKVGQTKASAGKPAGLYVDNEIAMRVPILPQFREPGAHVVDGGTIETSTQDQIPVLFIEDLGVSRPLSVAHASPQVPQPTQHRSPVALQVPIRSVTFATRNDATPSAPSIANLGHGVAAAIARVNVRQNDSERQLE
jgi:hypothetical protein